MKVNMTPNPLDVVTIHASQGDTEARQWEFELHNNGELIDTSDVTEQMVFKAYKGGTEQLLPENGSTPTTSPFKGDIRYPQGLLTDQEFTYRQSPTEEDGLAKITDIKGNTLVWNQLVKNGNFADTSNWVVSSNVTFTVGDNIATVTNALAGDRYVAQNIDMVDGHKYFFTADCWTDSISGNPTQVLIYFGSTSSVFNGKVTSANTWQTFSGIQTCVGNAYKFIRLRNEKENVINKFRNVMIIDLTAMGLDITDPSEFTSLFPLPYYDFNQGSLLSFNGTGIKTANADETEEHTTNLPVSTYFPTGMKSAGGVYDELTPTKGITRIGVVDLGTLDWELFDSRFGAYFNLINKTGKTNADLFPMLCAKYQTVRYYRGGVYMEGIDKSIAYAPGGGSRLYVEDSSYSDAVAFKTAMNGVYLCYEMATPIETSFTTASLVTENAEIPLSNEDGVLIGKCTEQLSAEPGFHDAKIKLADSDGTCYSNKLQLHVERSPQ